MLCLQPNPNISWQLNPKTPTQVRGQTLPHFQIIIILKKTGFRFRFSTEVRTGSLVFSQGITHDDNLRRSD
jgi:hypothetical protein